MPQAHFSVGDVTDLKFYPSAQFDKVLSWGVLFYLPDLESCERALHEALRKI